MMILEISTGDHILTRRLNSRAPQQEDIMTDVHSGKSKIEPTPHQASATYQQLDPTIKDALADNYNKFLQYLTRRLGDESTAEDVLQNFCMRVVTSGTKLRNSETVLGWLYTVLRSVLTDHYRSEAARRRRDAAYEQEVSVHGQNSDDDELYQALCECYHGLLPGLPAQYAEILRQADLQGAAREDIAANLGISPANVRVRLHRAREALRTVLSDCCGSCCKHSFRDCACGPETPQDESRTNWS